MVACSSKTHKVRTSTSTCGLLSEIDLFLKCIDGLLNRNGKEEENKFVTIDILLANNYNVTGILCAFN